MRRIVFWWVLFRFLNVFARQGATRLFCSSTICSGVDSATLDFLEYLFIHSGIRYLMIIGAYRDNEVGLGHPLVRALDTIRAGDAKVQEIVLSPLNRENIDTLVAEALHCQRERAQPLAQLLVEKDGRKSVLHYQVLDRPRRRGVARLRHSRADLAMGFSAHWRKKLHGQCRAPDS